MDIKLESRETLYLMNKKLCRITHSKQGNSLQYFDHNIEAANLESQTIMSSKGRFLVNGSSVQPKNIFYEINLETLAANKLAFMHSGRYSHTIIELGDMLIVTGGFNDQDYLDSCEAFDYESNTWTKISSLNQRRSNHVCFVFNQEIYIFGGICGEQSKSPNYLTSFEKLSKDVINAKWQTLNIKNSLEKFPVYSNSYLKFKLNDCETFLIFGDRDNSGERNNNIVSFNPNTLELTQTDFKLGNSNWFYRHIYFLDFENRHNFISRNGHLSRFTPGKSLNWELIREFVSVN